MDGRFFGGQKLAVSRYNGEHYNKTDDKGKHRKHSPDEYENDEDRIQEYINKVDEE